MGFTSYNEFIYSLSIRDWIVSKVTNEKEMAENKDNNLL